MPQVKITMHGRIPSKKNSTRRIKRGNRIFTVPSIQHEAWEGLQLATLPDNLDVIGLCQSISVYFYFPDNRRADMHNKFESIADVLVKKGIILDDSWQVVGETHFIPMGVSKDAPRAEILINY